MKPLLTVLLFSALLFTAFTLANDKPIEKAQWILGRWEYIDKDGLLTEEWTKQNDSVFVGYSSYVMHGETLFEEQLRMEQHGNDLFYIPTVKDQNGGKAVEFKLTAITANSFVFENPAHDFPQTISYTHPTPDSLVAEIAGTENGKFKRQQFLMVRGK
jgi:Domain of unknown function (DUF6265)